MDQEQFVPPTVPFWISAYFGTVVAGGAFGLLIGGWAGVIVGCFLAALVGAAIHMIAAILTWCFWLSPFRVVVAIIAGAATGTICSAVAVMFGQDSSLAFLSGALGAAGGGMGGGLYWLFALGQSLDSDPYKNRRWQFTMRDIFVYMTLLSILLALISSLVVALQAVR